MDLDELIELEAIRRLKHRYMRCVDQKRYDELAECFAVDARTAYDGGRLTYAGRDNIIAFLREAMQRPTLLTCHRVTQPELDLTSPTTATGTWALEETCHDLDAHAKWHAAAFYTDEYVKVDGKWQISFTSYERTYEDGTHVRTYP